MHNQVEHHNETVMKSVIGIIGAALLTASVFGQATMTMTYQAEIRNGLDEALSSTPVGMRVSVLKGSKTGPPVYVETHAHETDAYGLVTFDLGSGSPVSGRISDLDWSTGPYFLKTEIDPLGGDNYTAIVGTSRIESEAPVSGTRRYVGERYGGGIVFHVTHDGRHGLIHAVVEDAKRKKRQHRVHVDTIDFRGSAGAGRIMTEPMIRDIKSREGEVRIYALNEADHLSDWFLPTRYDLNLLYLNRAVIGGYSDFSRGWRKSDVSSVNAWFHSFTTGARFTNGKDDAIYVRVLRKF